jgi:hypothetical protein
MPFVALAKKGWLDTIHALWVPRFRAESYEWQAMKKQLDAKKGESAPKVWDLISDLNNTLGASIVIAYVMS